MLHRFASKNKMEKTEKTTTKRKTENDKVSCADKLCPFHGINALKLRGRLFEGEVIKKLKGRLTISFERTLYVPKFERYEKRKTKLHARLPDCLDNEIQVGDYIQIGETRPISKMIHFVVVKKIRDAQNKLNNEAKAQ